MSVASAIFLRREFNQEFYPPQKAILKTVVMRIYELFLEIGIKEFKSVLISLWQYVVYYFQPHKYNLDPQNPMIDQTKQTAKIVLLLPGQGSSPAVFLPLAKSLYNAEVQNVYTLKYPTKSNSISTKELGYKIKKISSQCFAMGCKKVEFALIGHSLGNIIASKYIWRDEHKDSRVSISMLFSSAGRLRYTKNKFWWICQNEKSEIEKNYRAFLQAPNKTKLYTIRGSLDELVPLESIHIQNDKTKELNVYNYGHLGIVYSGTAHKEIINRLKNWTKK